MPKFRIEITTKEGTRYEDADDVPQLARILQKVPLVLYSVSLHGDPLIYLMIAGTQAHLSLWKGPEDVYYVKTGSLDQLGTCDLGWNAYPEWMVTDNVPAAIEAALLYAASGDLDPKFDWEYQDLG